MNVIPRLSTITPMERVDAALATLRSVRQALSGSIVAREARDGFVSFTVMGPLGKAVVARLDDEDRHRSVLRMTCDAHPPLLASIEMVHAGFPKPERCGADDLADFSDHLVGMMSGAVPREPGTEPPYDRANIGKAFDLLRTAIEAQGIGTDYCMMTIRPSPDADRVWAYYTEEDGGSYECTASFLARLAPLCIKSDELSVCGTDATWKTAPLATHAGNHITHARAEQYGVHWERDPVSTLRMAAEIGEGPWLKPGCPF